MMQPEVSVIIPVYNKEKYLDVCLESVTKQSIQSIEIILIDDGSTDASPALCDKWEAKDARIRAIHKKNEGAGTARNLGIREAKGKFLSFVDADDYIAQNAYEICIPKMNETEADVCYFGRNIVSKGQLLSHAVRLEEEQVYKRDEIRKDFVNFFFGNRPEEEFKRNYVTGSSCCCLFNGDFIRKNEIFFPEKKIKYSEDAFFNLEICRYANIILVLPDMLYYNNVNQESKSRSYQPDRFEVYKLMYRKMQEYIEYFPEDEDADIRNDFKFVMNICKCVKAEVKERKRLGLRKAYKNVVQICKDEAVHNVMKKVIRPGIVSKRNMLLRLIYYRQSWIIFLYYMK